MEYTIHIVLIVAMLNMVFWWSKSHALGTECVTKYGKFDIEVGIEEADKRDFDLTIQWHPLWYITFQTALWCVYFNCCWSRDIGTYPDCDHKDAECYQYGQGHKLEPQKPMNQKPDAVKCHNPGMMERQGQQEFVYTARWPESMFVTEEGQNDN